MRVYGLGVPLFVVLSLPLQGQSGAEPCRKCHADTHRRWSGSLHRGSMQRAARENVLGDFGQGRLVLHGAPYVVRAAGGSWFITESDLTGKPQEHRVEYTLGGRRVQHYLTTLPDGKIVILPPTWDIARKQWTADLDIQNPEESAGAPLQVWNQSCYLCHASGGRKNFDAARDAYRTTWDSLGVGCEACHGPGQQHAQTGAKGKIVNPGRLDALRGTMVCAQCHSLRDVYAEGFEAGENYYDYFQPLMEYRLPATDDPAFWPDGRPRWLSNSAVAFWQSRCFRKGGATCGTCHAAHNETAGQASAKANAACAKCHAQIAANIPAHSHHGAGSPGSSCVACHMPPSVTALRAQIRDHSIGLPAPENTLRHQIPNACNLCHQDQDAAWAARRMSAWYGEGMRGKLVRRADAFTAARKGDVSAIPALLAILGDPSEGPWVRANAAGYLGSFPNEPTAYQAVLRAFSDTEPLVRATAVTALRPRAGQRPEAAAAMVPLLGDAVRTVRASAAVAMVAMGVQPFPGADGERFERAKDLYRARAALYSDDAGQQYAAGQFFYLAGDADASAAAFRAALKLNPAIPARYFLGRSLAKKGDYEGAREALKTVAADDPQAAAARQLLAAVEEKIREGGGATPAEVAFRNGEKLYQTEYYGAALKDFEQALALAPQAQWARKAQVYRAVCLEKLSRTSEAEAGLRALSAAPEAAQDLDLQLAYIELLYETGRLQQALARADALTTSLPKAPLAHFWHAKVLLALRRPEAAAAAAEESVRLMPEQPQAHNLLIRIYQVQGRMKEAAEQAQWLRDYERRVKSR